MKRFFIILLAVLLLFAGVAGYFTMKNRPAPVQDEPDPSVIEEPTEEGYGITLRTIDREAVYALHDPEEIVATIDGRDVTWDEYFYWLSSGAASVENYMLQMAFYGDGASWEDPWGDDPDEDFFDYVIYSAEENIKPFAVIEGIAKEYGVELDEAGQQNLADQLAQHRVEAVGEEGTDEEYAEYLRTVEHMRYETLETLMRDSALYQAGFTAIYGENGAKVTDEDAMAWLEESGTMRANHILRLTMDMDTGEALDEDAAAQKEAEAAAIAAQLQAIEDPEELLARLAELKEQWDEDSGKEANPDGYVFGEGEMVEPFETATKNLRDYQVSDPVKTEFGYHVIVRLPLDPETVIGYSSEGTPMTARAACANARYGQLLDEKLLAAKLQYAEGFEKPDLSQYTLEENL